MKALYLQSKKYGIINSNVKLQSIMSRFGLLLLASFTPFFLYAQFEGGTGTSSDPYQIQNLEQLQMIAEYPESNFILISDIDASETTEWNGGQGFKPIGSQEIPFSRSFFDGNNHTITGLYINRPEDNHIGLFGYVLRATLKNIVLEQVDIQGGIGTGSLAGVVKASDIFNSSASGIVKGKNGAGGLAGSVSAIIVYPIIINSRVGFSNTNVNVEGENKVGGLIGSSYGSLYNSYATGDVKGEEFVGGLVGDRLGGKMNQSYATGNVIGTTKVGGLVGQCRESGMGSPYGECSYLSIYSKGNVEGEEMVGGLIGELKHNDVLSGGYTSGNVTGLNNSGAVVGNYQGRSFSVYWDSTVSNQTTAAGNVSFGITALKTQEMKGDSALKYMEGLGFEKAWIPVDDNYPELLWTKQPGWVEQKYPVGITLNEYENGIDEVSFKWFSTDTVSSYHLQVSDESNFENLILDQESITEDSIGLALHLETETTYYWRVRAKNDFGYNVWSITATFETMMTTAIEEESIPQQVYLHQNYPNPFNPSTNISYELSKAGPVKLEVYDLLGKKVATLVNENKSSGMHSIRFDASGLSSGFYVYRLETETSTHFKKLLFLK